MNKELIKIKCDEDKDIVKKIIEENHYTHKMPQAVKYRFGLYYNNKLVGVAVFSVPANRFSITSIFKDESQQIGIELSRFFTYDGTPKNFESYCLKKCFEYIKHNSNYDVIISYADPNFNHVGYLYQALNGLYLGQTNPEIRYLYKGQLLTRRSLGRKRGDTETDHAKRIMADGAKRIKMIGKHKYLFFICDKRRKKELLHKIKENITVYDQSQYPKLKTNN